MTPERMKSRTKVFALRTIAFVGSLAANQATRVLGSQLLRSSTSVGANYRAACRARSTREFVSKLHTVLEEADECAYWLELFQDAHQGADPVEIETLRREASELVAIVASSLKTTKARLGRTMS
jgi:four helix bundle protein